MIAAAAADAHRAGPLTKVVVPGRFGADNDRPGVVLSLRHPLSIATVIARSGKAEALAKELGGSGYDVRWAGPGQFYVVAEGRGEGALYRELKEKLGDLASLSDQSHGRLMIRIGGAKSRNVLAKGTAVDLHHQEFPIGKSAVTQMAHIGAHLTRTGEDEFELSVFRGFARIFWEWLTVQAEEFGYEVMG
jgi:heterotetrameric sarcosine oxidase gamma subunit